MSHIENNPVRTLAQLGQQETDWLRKNSAQPIETSVQREAAGAAITSQTSRGLLYALDQNAFITREWLEENLQGYGDWMAAIHVVNAGWAMDGENGIGITSKGQNVARKIFEPRNPQQP